MASRRALKALAVVLQLSAVAGAGSRWGTHHGSRSLRSREGAQQMDIVQQEVQESSFLERNFAWIAPLPYLEGRAVSLVRRLDLSNVFPDKVEPLPGIPKKMEVEVPKVTPIPGTEQAKLPKELEEHAPKNPLINKKGNVEVDPEHLAASHPVVDKEGKPRDHTAIISAVVSSLSTVFIWAVFVMAAATLYRYTKDTADVDFEVVKAKGDFKDQDFKHGPFDCFSDMDVCCWSFWCSGVQWADTMGAVGILPFWAGFAAFILLGSLNFAFGFVAWPLVVSVFAYYRQDLRRKFHLQNEGSDMAKDFALWCCCSCCAIVQEARQVKEARQLAA